MPVLRRLFQSTLAALLAAVTLTGCFTAPTPPPVSAPSPLMDGGWVGHRQSLTAAGASPTTRIGGIVDDPAGCLSMVGSDHSRRPATGIVWTATADCTTLSTQWQASTEFETGTELTDITVLPTKQLIAVGHSLDNDSTPAIAMVAIRDLDGRWNTTALLGRSAGGPVSALGIERSESSLVIAGSVDDKAAVWHAPSSTDDFTLTELPVDDDFVSGQASHIAVVAGTVVVTGRGTDDDGGSTTLVWRSTDGGQTWNEVELPGDTADLFRISTVTVTDSDLFFAAGQTRAESAGYAMTSSDGVDWESVPVPDTGSMDVAIPQSDGSVLVTARPLDEHAPCGMVGFAWTTQAWLDVELPCSEPGEAAGARLSNGTIALLLGNELWLNEA